MFRDGNNQAMQLVMQGYSDSIKAKTSNQGTAMANAFNQGLSNAVQTHDNHEQAMQNREMTRLQNEYMNRTMDDRVRHQAQQTKANDLANEYTERTLDDRVAHQEQQTIANGLANESQWLNNNLSAMKNDTFKRTQESDISATNARNNINATLDQNYSKQFQNWSVKEINGKYYRADKNGNYNIPITEKEAERRMAHNARVNENIYNSGYKHIASDEAAATASQAQTAQNVNNMNMQNQQKAQFDEAKTTIQASGGILMMRFFINLVKQLEIMNRK